MSQSLDNASVSNQANVVDRSAILANCRGSLRDPFKKAWYEPGGDLESTG